MSGPTGLFKASRDLTVYKKAYWKGKQCIVTLLIPKGTLIYCYDANGKHRAERAKVLMIEELCRPKSGNGYCVRSGKKHNVANSGHDAKFKYYRGKLARPVNGFSGIGYGECASGIHFFRKESKARGYGY